MQWERARHSDVLPQFGPDSEDHRRSLAVLGINSGARPDSFMYIRQRRFSKVPHVVGDDDHHSGKPMGLKEIAWAPSVLCTTST